MSTPDAKTSPRHYAELRPEPITVIEGWGLGFHLGNSVKYIARAGRKPSEPALDDLRKARWYLDREIARLDGPRPRGIVELEEARAADDARRSSARARR